MGRPSTDRALLAFAAAVLVFHHVTSLTGDTAGDWIDLLTPFVVVGAASVLLVALDAPTLAIAVAIVAAVLYVDGHGIHLSANSIGHEALQGEARRVTHFWDEEWGHAEWHLGLFGLLLAFCLAERRPARLQPWLAVLSVVMLGWTFFTIDVEGGTWWLELATTALFLPWALAARRPLLVACASAFALGALLIGIWAVWQGGMPQFSDLGWI